MFRQETAVAIGVVKELVQGTVEASKKAQIRITEASKQDDKITLEAWTKRSSAVTGSVK